MKLKLFTPHHFVQAEGITAEELQYYNYCPAPEGWNDRFDIAPGNVMDTRKWKRFTAYSKATWDKGDGWGDVSEATAYPVEGATETGAIYIEWLYMGPRVN